MPELAPHAYSHYPNLPRLINGFFFKIQTRPVGSRRAPRAPPATSGPKSMAIQSLKKKKKRLSLSNTESHKHKLTDLRHNLIKRKKEFPFKHRITNSDSQNHKHKLIDLRIERGHEPKIKMNPKIKIGELGPPRLYLR